MAFFFCPSMTQSLCKNGFRDLETASRLASSMYVKNTYVDSNLLMSLVAQCWGNSISHLCLGGHPQFIHYPKSCSNPAWDVKRDTTFPYCRERECELTEIYFNELCVCLTSFLLFQIQTWPHMKAVKREENQTA